MARKHGSASGPAKPQDRVIDVSPVLSLLLEHVSDELCESVFQDVRDTERRRLWTLAALARFWLAVVLNSPPALKQLLEQARAGDGTGLLPAVAASNSAFYARCQDLPSAFFEVLYVRFIERLVEKRRGQYVTKLRELANRFTSVIIIDGSRLDRIAHKLKILRHENAVVLPGCLSAVYDLSQGVATQLWFDADAASSEHTRAVQACETFPAGTLVLGDRLYSSIVIFDTLDAAKCYGVFRRNATIKLKPVKTLSATKLEGGGTLKDDLVEAGTAERKRMLRRVTLMGRGPQRVALTNALDPAVLSAEEVAELYPHRWKIERLFFDLKEVLNLKRLYPANPNAVAMQVFATAMVHAAFRVAQGKIALAAKVEPEQLSPAKLFPRLALSCISLLEFEYSFLLIQRANPKVRLKKPSVSHARNQSIRLSWILVQVRSTKRRKKKYTKARAKWKSLKKVRGGLPLS